MKRSAALLVLAGFVFTPNPAAAEDAGSLFMQSWDLDGNGAITSEEALERRNDLFSALDSNQDGFLDRSEYPTIEERGSTESAGNEEKSAVALRGLSMNDLDGDGKVSAGEFLENSSSWVELLDGNGDGAITESEFEVKWQDRDGRIRLFGGR